MAMEDHGISGLSEWSNNILSRRTVRHACGQLGVEDIPYEGPTTDDGRLARAVALARSLKTIIGDGPIRLGSRGGVSFDAIAMLSQSSRMEISARTIRAVMGRALYPHCTIKLEAINTSAAWWQLIEDEVADLAVERREEARDLKKRWSFLVAAFADRSVFVSTAMVSIDSCGDTLGGCVGLRLLVGRLPDGSLAGLLGALPQP